MSPKAEGGLWNSRGRSPREFHKPPEGEGHLITNFPTYHGISFYFSPCSVSFVLSGEYIQYSPLINFRLIIPSNIHLQLIIPSNIHLQCLCSTKNEKKQHHQGNMALRIIYILNH